MFTKQKQVINANSAVRIFKNISLTMKIKMRLPHCLSNISPQSTASSHRWSKEMIVVCSSILITSLIIPPAYADSNTQTRWYRYYDSRGIPSISSTVSEQHLQQGYDVLDSHMQLIRHYPPFSADKYAQQQTIREQAIAKKINDRHLQETYISSDHAITQRDRELSDIDGQIKQSTQQSAHLSKSLNDNITLAASYERQNKPIPALIKAQLNKNKALLAQSDANIAALKTKREQTNKQFNDAITELKSVEQQGNKPNTTSTP